MNKFNFLLQFHPNTTLPQQPIIQNPWINNNQTTHSKCWLTPSHEPKNQNTRVNEHPNQSSKLPESPLKDKSTIQKWSTCNGNQRIILLRLNLVTTRSNQPLLHSLTKRTSHMNNSNCHIQFLSVLVPIFHDLISLGTFNIPRCRNQAYNKYPPQGLYQKQ